MGYDIDHALTVASHFEVGSDEWIVALLHDVLEDTNVTAGDLRNRFKLSEKLIQDIVIISRDIFNEESYNSYIRRVYFGGTTVKAVKLADLRENLKRSQFPNSPYNTLVKRYEWAIEYLES